MKNAFEEVERQGLLKYILTWDGSWVPRHIGWNRRRALSRHSWGIVFGINARWNGYGKAPARASEHGTVRPLVPIFESRGFCWGGGWKKPDGMHFELAEMDPSSQCVRLFIDGIEVPDAEVAPRAQLPDLFVGVKETRRRHGVRSVSYGHAGDGNLRVDLLKDTLTDDEWAERRPPTITEIFKHCVSLGGTISGDHGIGWSQKPHLPLALSEAELEVMRSLKKTLDPAGILNPGKVFDA